MAVVRLIRRFIHWLLEVPDDKRWTLGHKYFAASDDPDNDITYW